MAVGPSPSTEQIRNHLTGFRGFIQSVWNMYYEGFRNMTIGKTLWIIILIKLFLFFVIVRLIFFPDILQRDFENDEERAEHVRHELTRPR